MATRVIIKKQKEEALTKAMAVIKTRAVTKVKKKKKVAGVVLSPFAKDIVSTKPLNIQQELFCQLYVKSDKMRGNGTKCYAYAYGYQDYENLSRETTQEQRLDENDHVYWVNVDSLYERKSKELGVNASRLLAIDRVRTRINELRKEMIEDEIVDNEMVKVILQDNDLSAKMKGIGEYNKLKQRIIEKSEVVNKTLIFGVVKNVYEEAERRIKEKKNGR